jgi:hypothetical protein
VGVCSLLAGQSEGGFGAVLGETTRRFGAGFTAREDTRCGTRSYGHTGGGADRPARRPSDSGGANHHARSPDGRQLSQGLSFQAFRGAAPEGMRVPVTSAHPQGPVGLSGVRFHRRVVSGVLPEEDPRVVRLVERIKE